MFTADNIKAAHAKVKSGADFPAYIQELIAIGLSAYTDHVSNGQIMYTDENGKDVIVPARYAQLQIAKQGDRAQFKNALELHQQGGSDYLTFCIQAAAAGVEKWVVKVKDMSCTYYDKEGNIMLVETIPLP